MARSIDIPVRLDARAFRRFCAFDTFRRQRRWYPPVMAAMLLVTLALAGLIGLVPLPETASGVLMGLGLAIPMVIFGLYFIQIEAQIARQGLKNAPIVYTLRLNEQGVRVTGGQGPHGAVELAWESLWAAFRRPGAVYLYANPARAFILPDGQASVSANALWDYLLSRMGTDRCIDSARPAARRAGK